MDHARDYTIEKLYIAATSTVVNAGSTCGTCLKYSQINVRWLKSASLNAIANIPNA